MTTVYKMLLVVSLVVIAPLTGAQTADHEHMLNVLQSGTTDYQHVNDALATAVQRRDSHLLIVALTSKNPDTRLRAANLVLSSVPTNEQVPLLVAALEATHVWTRQIGTEINAIVNNYGDVVTKALRSHGVNVSTNELFREDVRMMIRDDLRSRLQRNERAQIANPKAAAASESSDSRYQSAVKTESPVEGKTDESPCRRTIIYLVIGAIIGTGVLVWLFRRRDGPGH